jgi:hypothetical protein
VPLTLSFQIGDLIERVSLIGLRRLCTCNLCILTVLAGMDKLLFETLLTTNVRLVPLTLGFKTCKLIEFVGLVIPCRLHKRRLRRLALLPGQGDLLLMGLLTFFMADLRLKALALGLDCRRLRLPPQAIAPRSVIEGGLQPHTVLMRLADLLFQMLMFSLPVFGLGLCDGRV